MGLLIFTLLLTGETHISSVKSGGYYIQSEGQSDSSPGAFAVGALYAHRLQYTSFLKNKRMV
jgi:hypothetical protein